MKNFKYVGIYLPGISDNMKYYTGYALVAQYTPTANLDNDAAVYGLVDLDKDTNVILSHIISFVVNVQIECDSCGEKTSFQTSKNNTDTHTHT